jgi:pyruvate/2-oxoglutarate dehydrogenase complex dihydrolipoamide dehydrogenase (E3) component
MQYWKSPYEELLLWCKQSVIQQNQPTLQQLPVTAPQKQQQRRQQQQQQRQRFVARCNSTLWSLQVLIFLLVLQPQLQVRNLRHFTIGIFPPMVHAMSMPMPSSTIPASASSYDVVIIGGGSAGLTAAKLIGPTLQKSCCIIEQHKLGGDCTWTGCIPSKSFIAASKLHYRTAQRTSTSDTTQHTPLPPLADFATIKKEIQSNIQQIYDADDSPEALQKLGNIDVIYGQATLASSKMVHVDIPSTDINTNTNTNTPTTQQQRHMIHATKGIILCTGAQPKLPTSIPGLDTYYTYETLWDQLVTIPKQLIIIGGGPIGCEIAQAMARFGSNVTIITTSKSILPQEDPDVSQLMSDLFTTQYNIRILHGRVTKVDQVYPATTTTTTTDTAMAKSHAVHVSLLSATSNSNVAEADTTTIVISGDAILVAIGRQPRSIPGYQSVGIELNDVQTAIKVNAQLQTSVKDIYAAGDCTGDRQLYVLCFLREELNYLHASSLNLSNLLVSFSIF